MQRRFHLPGPAPEHPRQSNFARNPEARGATSAPSPAAREATMRFLLSVLAGLLLAPAAFAQTQPAAPAPAAPGAPAATAPAAPAPPTFATTKVEGTDNVYIFR